MPQSTSPGEGEQPPLEAGLEPAPEPDLAPEPAAPRHQLDVDLPMAQRSAAQVRTRLKSPSGAPSTCTLVAVKKCSYTQYSIKSVSYALLALRAFAGIDQPKQSKRSTLRGARQNSAELTVEIP